MEVMRSRRIAGGSLILCVGDRNQCLGAGLEGITVGALSFRSTPSSPSPTPSMSSFEKVVKNACKPKHAPPKAKVRELVHPDKYAVG